MGVQMGPIIKRLLLMHPLNTLSEDDQMIVAGQLGGAMQEVLRLAQGPMTEDEIKHALNNPDFVMVSRANPKHER
jgi:hypothetical protein